MSHKGSWVSVLIWFLQIFEYALGKSLVFFFSSGPSEHVLVIHLCYTATFSFTFDQGLRNGWSHWRPCWCVAYWASFLSHSFRSNYTWSKKERRSAWRKRTSAWPEFDLDFSWIFFAVCLQLPPSYLLISAPYGVYIWSVLGFPQCQNATMLRLQARLEVGPVWDRFNCTSEKCWQHTNISAGDMWSKSTYPTQNTMEKLYLLSSH